MALDIVVDKLDAVPEAIRTLYVEKDGKFHLDVAGMPDVKAIQAHNTKLNEENKTRRLENEALAARFKDVDPDKYRTIMSKFDNDEEAQLLAAGKIDDVIARRTAKLRDDMQKQLDIAKAETNAAKESGKKFLGKVLDDAIRAAVNGKVHPGASDDALFRARTMFTVDDNGAVIQKDEHGQVVLGKDGKTPFTPVEWIESMRDTAPHWFPATGSGTGSQQSQGAPAGKTIKRTAFDAMSGAEQAATIKAGVIPVD